MSRRQARASKHSTRHEHRIIIALSLISLAALSALFISYINWQQLRTAASVQSTQELEFADLDRRVAAIKKRQIEDAKKAELAAKQKAEADARAGAATPSVPTGSADGTNCGVESPASITVVINKKHCFSPLEWAPADLVSVDGFLVRAEAAAQLQAMMTAAATAGVPFSMSSTYRSYQNQVVTYNTWVGVNGSAAAADTVSARPGYSEHQTGLAIDLKAGNCTLGCFGTSPAYQWLRTNAATYGYIERYPPGLTAITGYSPESWHWRYVGPTTATDMKNKSIETLESYFNVTGGNY